MMVSYRMNGASGTMMLPSDDLQICFNKIAMKLINDGVFRDDYIRAVRYEGKVKIGKKKYHAVSQNGLTVVADGPKIPDKIELRF